MGQIYFSNVEAEYINELIDDINNANDKYELTDALNKVFVLIEGLEIEENDTIGVMEELGYDYNYVKKIGIEAADGQAEWFRVIEEDDDN